MPRRIMDDLKGCVAYDKIYEGALGDDIFSADLDGEDTLLPNIWEHCVRRISDDLCRFVGGEGIGKVPKPPLHVSSECAPALVCSTYMNTAKRRVFPK